MTHHWRSLVTSLWLVGLAVVLGVEPSPAQVSDQADRSAVHRTLRALAPEGNTTSKTARTVHVLFTANCIANLESCG